jgi:predicted transcriptional regulator
MSTYFEYVFGFAIDIFELLAKGYGHYSENEFILLLNQAKLEHESLKEENKRLKEEIDKINLNIISSLESDLSYMKKSVKNVIHRKSIERLDV